MEPDEYVLSDVHLNHSSYETSDNSATKVVRTRFLFKDVSLPSLDQRHKTNLVDEDGDLDPIRPDEVHLNTVYIDHCLATQFKDVGLQIWSACLLLCDFILDNKGVFKSKIILELGAGVGLASLAVSKYADTVICTDSSPDALELCERNFALNDVVNDQDNTKFRGMDWSQDVDCLDWSQEDMDLLKSVDVVMASDVVFSDELTEDLINCLIQIISKSSNQSVSVFIALEKRLNFTLEARDVACPSYTYFLEHMEGLCSGSSKVLPTHMLKFDRIENIKQYFVYERSNYLELWHLEATKC